MSERNEEILELLDILNRNIDLHIMSARMIGFLGGRVIKLEDRIKELEKKK